MTGAVAPSPAPLPAKLVLFDGVCGFCDRLVRALVRADPERRLRYAPLQGDTAAALRIRHPEIPDSIDTLVYVESDASGERVFLYSSGIFRIAAQLRGPLRWFSWLRILPRPLADTAYRLFLRHRYRIFGRLDECRLPDAAERELFLP